MSKVLNQLEKSWVEWARLNSQGIDAPNPAAAAKLVCAAELRAALPAVEAERKELVEALEAIGGMPDGFCVCFNSFRDPLKPNSTHTGECRQARAVLARVKGE